MLRKITPWVAMLCLAAITPSPGHQGDHPDKGIGQNRADDRARAILQAADRYRNGWTSFMVESHIVNYEDGQKQEEGRFQVMIKGSEKSLVRFLNPDQKGQYLLMVKDNMWIYMPNTRRPIRITPLQRLMGDASNGDIARTNFSLDYEPKLVGEEIVAGQPCHMLELTATSDAATYARVKYWVTKKDALPMKAELYLASGKNHKSINYDQYEIIGGRKTLIKMTLYDRLRSGNRFTTMEFVDYREADFEDKYFNKNFLVHLK